MKGIYKKISVGVLVAGLLVGGSGALQVGQAFADSNIKKNEIKLGNEEIEINEHNEREYRNAGDVRDEEEGYDWFQLYKRGIDRINIVSLVESKKIKDVREIIVKKGSKIDAKYEYKDGWGLKDAIKNGKVVKGESNIVVKIGENLYFRISL